MAARVAARALRRRPRTLRTAKRAVRAAGLLAREDRIPRPLRWLAFVGLLPVPGPFDEAVMLVAAGLLWAFYRDEILAAWARAA